MSPDELRVFERNRFHRDAVRLRRWDDRAKVPGAAVQDAREFASILHRIARPY